MITKYLVVDRQVYLEANRPSPGDNDRGKVIKVKMPIEVYWKAADLLTESERTLAQSDHPEDVRSLYRKLIKLVAPYAAEEKDRAWLYETWL